MNRPAILFSIKKEFADSIFDGSKTFELRRVCPNIEPGDRIFLYTTSPHSSLDGYFEVKEVVTGSPTYIWDKVGSKAGISRREMYRYLSGGRSPCAIRVKSVRKFNQSLTLDDIRRIWKEFRPPQSFRYIPDVIFSKLQVEGTG